MHARENWYEYFQYNIYKYDKCKSVFFLLKKLNYFSVNLLLNYREARSCPNEWLITSTLSTVGSLAYNYEVKVKDAFVEPIFLYSVILGMPSTKKSSVIKFFKDEVMKLTELKPDSVHLDTSTIIINF